MYITLKELKNIIDEGIELYGEDTNLMVRMKNEEQFDTGWYETFEGISINKEDSFKGEDAVSGIGFCLLDIKTIGY